MRGWDNLRGRMVWVMNKMMRVESPRNETVKYGEELLRLSGNVIENYD